MKELTAQESLAYHLATISLDDRHIYTSIRTEEADICLLTLNEER